MKKVRSTFQGVAPGNYDVLAGSRPKAYSVLQVSSDGNVTNGHTLTVAAGASMTVALSLAEGTVNIEGFAKRAGKGTSGAMVVLVPNRSRSQSRTVPPRPERSGRKLPPAQHNSRHLHHRRHRKRLGSRLVPSRRNRPLRQARTNHNRNQPNPNHHAPDQTQ